MRTVIWRRYKSGKRKKWYVVRDSEGKFKKWMSYAVCHRRDLKRKSKAERRS